MAVVLSGVPVYFPVTTLIETNVLLSQRHRCLNSAAYLISRASVYK